MKNFKIRTTGDDLAVIPFYNTYGNGLYNAFYPEFAPFFVGGTMSGLTNKNAKGNCTWYAFGRRQEAVGDRFPLEKRRGNARDWVVDSNTPEVGAIVVFDDSDYGHVAFIESIEGDRVIVSESVYSERGNDVLFRIGRTVSQICSEWGMTVKGYIAPPEKCASYYNEVASAPKNGLVSQILALTGDNVTVYDYNSGIAVGSVNPSAFEGKLTYPILEVGSNGDLIIETESYGKVRVPEGLGSIYVAQGIQLKGDEVTVYDYYQGTALGVVNPPLDYAVDEVSTNGDIVITTRDYGKVRVNNREIFNIYG